MRSVGRATDRAAKDRRKRQASPSDSSDDSESGKDSRKKSKHLEKVMLKAREEDKALKLQLQEMKAKNEAAKEKLNEMKLAVVMIFSIFSFYSISDAVYIAPGATVRDRASGFTECLHPW
jgi:hypothetical protein